MAGAEKIVERILADARQQAEALVAEAEEKAAGIIAQGEKEAEKSRQEILERARTTAEERRRRILTIAELEGKSLPGRQGGHAGRGFTLPSKSCRSSMSQPTEDHPLPAPGQRPDRDGRSHLHRPIKTGDTGLYQRSQPELKARAVGNLTLVVKTVPWEGFILRSGGWISTTPLQLF